MAKKKSSKRPMKPYWTFVNDITYYLKDHFYLHSWTLHVLQVKNDKTSQNDTNAEVIASMGSDDTYMDATLSLYPLAKRMWKERRCNSLGRAIVHEFCHVITDPLYKIACNGICRREGPGLEHTRENTTQHICNIVMPGIDKKIFSPYKNIRSKRQCIH